jgi:hypothetical protein
MTVQLAKSSKLGVIPNLELTAAGIPAKAIYDKKGEPK